MEMNFKTYIGTKTVQAARMTAAKAKDAGANVPDKYFEIDNADYDPGADGYLVICPDGYCFWSPAEVFEESYKVAETHVDRMKAELADLNERICKATRAINTYGAIPEDDRWQLKEQVGVMQKYADILYLRIRHAVAPLACAVSSEPCCKAAHKEGGDQ